MKRKIKDYKDKKVAIHCSSKEEWDKIVDSINNGNVKKIHWQDKVNSGLSDTINIDGKGWSPKEHYIKKQYTIYPASDFLEEVKSISKEDLVKGEIYLYDDNHIAIYPKGGNVHLNSNSFTPEKEWAWSLDIKNTTPEQKHWLNECIKANKFIPYDEAMKFFFELPYKFNIGNEIKAKPGGYYICEPRVFAESHKTSFPSEKSAISGKITERTHAQGFNWYRVDYSNWITEEGIELVEGYPEYVKCIKSYDNRFTLGKIYKVESVIDKRIVLLSNNGKNENPTAYPLNGGIWSFEPAIKEDYDKQAKSITEDEFYIELKSQKELDAIMDFYKAKGYKEKGDSHIYFYRYGVIINNQDKTWQTSVNNFKPFPVKTLSELGIFADNFYKKEEKEMLEMLPYPKDNYFKAVVVKDIHREHIPTKGSIPDLIPKGYQTWFRDVGTYYEENIFSKNKCVVCPENNRWHANIPAEYFQIVQEKESEMLVFGKYKVGDVVVSLEHKSPYRVVGDMFKVLKSSIDALYYLHDTCSLASKEWRAATEEEIKAFQQGIKNVNNIPKIGDYVVITKGTDNWSSKMDHYIGKVAKLTSCLSYDKNTFRIDLDNGDWEWQLKHNHFRKAKPDEIPLKQTTMSMQEIQQICKEKYPIGCKYKCASFNYEYILLQDDCTYTIINNEIWASRGKGCLYSNGKYAELISLPDCDWNPQIGDHVIIISPEKKNNWVSGMDKYVGKLDKLTKKRGDTSFEIDLDNAFYVWDYKPLRKFFRKAEPHEISTISKSFEIFKEGDKVLIKDGCGYYHQGIDSIGEKMIGIISKVTSSSLPFIVKWSNGSQNSYNKEHLEHYVEMTLSKSISPTMLEIAKSKYPLGTFYIDLYERKQEVRGTLTIQKDMITDGWGGAVYEKGKWAKIVDALYNDNKSEQKTSTSENYPLTSTKSVTKKKKEITLVPLIQSKTVKVFDREENFF